MAQNTVLSIPASKPKLAVELMIACLGSCFLAILSQIAIPLIGTPIPVTLQTLAVFLLGGILGSRRAANSVLAYLIQGSLFLPVFAGGVANPLWLLGPQAGFLVSFLAGAYLIGKMIEKKRPAFFYILFAMVIGQLVIYGIGMGWLSCFIGLKKAFFCGVVPFLPGAALKILAASLIVCGYRNWREKA